MKSLSPTPELSGNPAARAWLASLLLRRDTRLSFRFARACQTIAAWPRPWRRRLQRKMSVTLASAALLFALAAPAVIPAARAEPAAPEATITVVNGEVANINNGKCGLIEAIINARTAQAGQLRPDCAAGNLGGPDTVSLPANGDFVLIAPHNSQFGPTGLPVITSAVTIEGHGSTIRRSSVSGTEKFRILATDDAGSLTLRNVIIRNGYAPTTYQIYDGGGVLNKNVLVVEGATFLDNRAEGSGGGIYAEAGATTTVTGSAFVGNWAVDYYESGGGLALAGDATIVGSTITGNRAQDGGGLTVLETGSVTITESLVARNFATSEYGGDGGGVSVSGTAVIIDTTIEDNLAAGNIDYGGYGGGIIVHSDATATISGSTIAGNSATSGGQYGAGAPWDGPGLGGGILVFGTATVSNTTISGNDANRGGGVMNGGELTLAHSTVTGNLGRRQTDDYQGFEDIQPGRGGGLYMGYLGCGNTTLKGVILSGNTADDGGPEALIVQDPDCTQVVHVNAFNVFGKNGASGLVGLSKGATDIVPSVGLSAILGPLASNGGSTQTHALAPGSPAVDLAPNASCTAAPVNGLDQRGEPRNANGKDGVTANECDAGSFELQPAAQLLPFLISPATSGTVGGVAFTPADILKYDPATGWSLYFDASDVNVTKNVAAFEVLGSGNILMSFAANQTIAGAGIFTPQDIARFVPTQLGATTTGSFQWELDGSTRGLTTTGEKIDALGDIGDGRLAISTVGSAAVPGPSGTIKAQDEDALGLNRTSKVWSAYFNGTPVPGLAVEDVNALWVDPATGDLYLSILGAFNLGGLVGNGKDIVKLTVNPSAPGGYTPSLWWDGSAAGFPSTIDGLEILK